MSWRSLVISRPSKISIKNNQLVISQEEEVSMPVEDITSIVIESPQVVITVKALDLLSSNNTMVYICNDKHIPSSYFLPFYQHSRQYGIIKMQLAITEPFKKRAWQQIIKQKIKNQAYVLFCMGKREEAERISSFETQVDSGDSKNIEGYVAKQYFEMAFGKRFTRNSDNIYNACLDYGYSILRGAIARIISKYGFIPSIGIHHKSELNNYNLADDFIEPFRPIIDMWVTQNIVNEDTEFSKEIRAKLVDLLNYEVIIDGKRQCVSNAINIMLSYYSTAVQSKDYSKIVLPILVPLERHEYE